VIKKRDRIDVASGEQVWSLPQIVWVAFVVIVIVKIAFGDVDSAFVDVLDGFSLGLIVVRGSVVECQFWFSREYVIIVLCCSSLGMIFCWFSFRVRLKIGFGFR